MQNREGEPTSTPLAVQRVYTHLDENQVPDLQHIGVILIHEAGCISTTANAVIVNFRAGTAGALVSHLPEVVLAAEREHPCFWQIAQPDQHHQGQSGARAQSCLSGVYAVLQCSSPTAMPTAICFRCCQVSMDMQLKRPVSRPCTHQALTSRATSARSRPA